MLEAIERERKASPLSIDILKFTRNTHDTHWRFTPGYEIFDTLYLINSSDISKGGDGSLKVNQIFSAICCKGLQSKLTIRMGALDEKVRKNTVYVTYFYVPCFNLSLCMRKSK